MEMIQFDEHFFQMGWNHQLVIHVNYCRISEASIVEMTECGQRPGKGRLNEDPEKKFWDPRIPKIQMYQEVWLKL